MKYKLPKTGSKMKFLLIYTHFNEHILLDPNQSCRSFLGLWKNNWAFRVSGKLKTNILML